MIITAIRHTSVDAPKGVCYGVTDVPVAPSFPEEVEAIRKNLDKEEFNVIFSSPLQRCTQLAFELAGNCRVITDPRVTELDFGDWEMRTWVAIFESPEGKTWFQDYAHASCPNGESFAELVARVKLFLGELKPFENEKIALITHAGVIRALMCLLQGKTADEAFRIPVDNGQIITFNFNPGWRSNP